jgi:HNH endonuclease
MHHLRPPTTVSVSKMANSRTVHSLVMEAFVGPRPDGLEVRHLDGVPSNNALPNRECVTRSRNIQDMKWHAGRRGHKLRPADVRDIKQRLRGPRGKLAREYGVSDFADQTRTMPR